MRRREFLAGVVGALAGVSLGRISIGAPAVKAFDPILDFKNGVEQDFQKFRWDIPPLMEGDEYANVNGSIRSLVGRHIINTLADGLFSTFLLRPELRRTGTAIAEMSGCIVDPKLAAFNQLVNVYLNHHQSTKNRQAKLTDVYKAVQLPKTQVLTEINKRVNQ